MGLQCAGAHIAALCLILRGHIVCASFPHTLLGSLAAKRLVLKRFFDQRWVASRLLRQVSTAF